MCSLSKGTTCSSLCGPIFYPHQLCVCRCPCWSPWYGSPWFWEPTRKAKTAEDDHTADSLTARPVPAQALLKGHKYSSHNIVTRKAANQWRVQPGFPQNWTQIPPKQDHIHGRKQEGNPTLRSCHWLRSIQGTWACTLESQGKMQSPLISAALQNRFTADSVSLHLHLWRFALHTSVQWCNTNALQQCSGQNAIPTVQCCSCRNLLFIQVCSKPATKHCS